MSFSVTMMAKEISVGKSIIGLKKHHKRIREIAKIFGSGKINRQRTGQLSNTKTSGRQKTTKLQTTERIISTVKKNVFITSYQVYNAVKEIEILYNQ